MTEDLWDVLTILSMYAELVELAKSLTTSPEMQHSSDDINEATANQERSARLSDFNLRFENPEALDANARPQSSECSSEVTDREKGQDRDRPYNLRLENPEAQDANARPQSSECSSEVTDGEKGQDSDRPYNLRLENPEAQDANARPQSSECSSEVTDGEKGQDSDRPYNLRPRTAKIPKTKNDSNGLQSSDSFNGVTGRQKLSGRKSLSRVLSERKKIPKTQDNSNGLQNSDSFSRVTVRQNGMGRHSDHSLRPETEKIPKTQDAINGLQNYEGSSEVTDREKGQGSNRRYNFRPRTAKISKTENASNGLQISDSFSVVTGSQKLSGRHSFCCFRPETKKIHKTQDAKPRLSNFEGFSRASKQKRGGRRSDNSLRPETVKIPNTQDTSNGLQNCEVTDREKGQDSDRRYNFRRRTAKISKTENASNGLQISDSFSVVTGSQKLSERHFICCFPPETKKIRKPQDANPRLPNVEDFREKTEPKSGNPQANSVSVKKPVTKIKTPKKPITKNENTKHRYRLRPRSEKTKRVEKKCNQAKLVYSPKDYLTELDYDLLDRINNLYGMSRRPPLDLYIPSYYSEHTFLSTIVMEKREMIARLEYIFFETGVYLSRPRSTYIQEFIQGFYYPGKFITDQHLLDISTTLVRIQEEEVGIHSFPHLQGILISELVGNKTVIYSLSCKVCKSVYFGYTEGKLEDTVAPLLLDDVCYKDRHSYEKESLAVHCTTSPKFLKFRLEVEIEYNRHRGCTVINPPPIVPIHTDWGFVFNMNYEFDHFVGYYLLQFPDEVKLRTITTRDHYVRQHGLYMPYYNINLNRAILEEQKMTMELTDLEDESEDDGIYSYMGDDDLSSSE